MLICKHCQKNCKNSNSLRNHERLCKSNSNRQSTWFEHNQPEHASRRNQYTKAEELGIEVYGKQSTEAKAKLAKINKERGQTEEAKAKLSKIAKERGLGGHTSKQRLYFKKTNGEVVYLQSSYEIKFAQLLEELCVEWSRPEPLIWLDAKGDDHRYYPDFKIGNKYFDTKNDYLAIIDADKIDRASKQNNVIVEIVTHNNITREYIEKALFV